MRGFAVAALAGLLVSLSGAAEVSYPPVVPGYRIEMPRDEGSHPEFRTEWWYLTGWLETEQGEPLGFQLTFFRTRPGVDESNPSRFALRQVLFAHLALSDPRRGTLLHHEKSARAGFGLAAAAEGSLDVHIDDWFMRKEGDSYVAAARATDLSLELRLQPTQPPILQGESGFSQKGPQPLSASYYYSIPQLQAAGKIVVDGREQAVRGRAWFDHEWSSALLDQEAEGWDWAGLNLDDGSSLAVARVRGAQGSEHWAAATYRHGPDMAETRYGPGEVEWVPLRHWRSPRTGARYPVEWQVTVGERTIRLRPLMDAQENDARNSTGTIYWEGAVRAFDEHDRQIGRGYLELTGYAAREAPQ